MSATPSGAKEDRSSGRSSSRSEDEYPTPDPNKPHPWSVGLPVIHSRTGERNVGIVAVESPQEECGLLVVTFSDGQRKVYQIVTDLDPVGREESEVALDGIAAMLNGVEWETSYLDDVARIVRATGREVAEYESPEDR